MSAARFSVEVIHRRAGKTVMAVNHHAMDMLTGPPRAVGAYIAPQYRQAARVAWPYFMHYLRDVPGVEFNKAELCVTYPHGAKTYLLGAENPDPLRGLGLYRFVFDEVAQCPRRAWTEVVRPACADHGGGGIFIGTVMGMGNLFYELYRDAEALPDWHRNLLTVEQTDALAPVEVEALRREMSENEFAQEMLCDWGAAIRGAFYGKQMALAEREGRIGRVPHDPALPVYTSWDIGFSDTTVITCWQVAGPELRVIRCLAYEQSALPDIIAELGKLPYTWATHYGPHDLKVREFGSGRSRLETASALGFRFDLAPNQPVRDGIEATRNLLARCWFDREGAGDLVEALKTYRTDYDENREVYRLQPLHSWESHYADSVRYFAVSYRPGSQGMPRLDYSRLNRRVI